MNRGILGQAGNRLAAAKKKASAIGRSRSQSEIIELWSEFLTEQSRFFNRLGNAMDTDSERGWFDRVINARNQDEVMSYLLHARNADEHGRSSVATPGPSGVEIGTPGRAMFIKNMEFSSLGISKLEGCEGAPGQSYRGKFCSR